MNPRVYFVSDLNQMIMMLRCVCIYIKMRLSVYIIILLVFLKQTTTKITVNI